MQDFFRHQKEKGLMKSEYDTELFWEGKPQDLEGADMSMNPDWTQAEIDEYEANKVALNRTATNLEKAARWLDTFTYW